MAGERAFAIWEGVYDHWADAPVVEGAFDSEKWLEDQERLARAELSEFNANEALIASNCRSNDYILPTVAAMASSADRALRVLDFGGGLGSSYFLVRGSLPPAQQLEFHVVESDAVCAKGAEVFADTPGVHFSPQLPEKGSFDIIHAGRSFQYVDDWRGLLRDFARLTDGYVVLAGALAGNIDPFVSLQNYYGYKIRVRFLNLRELVSEAEEVGFTLIGKSLHLSRRLGKVGPLPMDNFPPERRIEHPSQLLFRRFPQ